MNENVQTSLVEETLKLRLSNLQNLHIKLAREVDHNPFLRAISFDISIKSKLSRSLTAKLGNTLALVARDLAKIRYGQNNVPSVIAKASLDKKNIENTAHHQDTLIATDTPKDDLLSASNSLIRYAGSEAKIGSKKFRQQYMKTIEELNRLPRIDIWFTQVDLYIDNNDLGFCELESGGELDSANVTAQPAKLIRAGLALGEPEKRLFFCLAYANKGEGNSIKGGLPKYFEYESEAETREGLVVGSAWWHKVLPKNISYENFLQIFSRVAKDLNITN